MTGSRPPSAVGERLQQQQAHNERFVAAAELPLERYRHIDPSLPLLLPAEVPVPNAVRPFSCFSPLERLSGCHWALNAAFEQQLDEVTAYPFLLVARERRRALEQHLAFKLAGWDPDEIVACGDATAAFGASVSGLEFSEAERGLALLRSAAEKLGQEVPRLRPRPALIARENEACLAGILQKVFKDSRRVGARLLDRTRSASAAEVVSDMLAEPHRYGTLRRGGATWLGRIDGDDLSGLLGEVAADMGLGATN